MFANVCRNLPDVRSNPTLPHPFWGKLTFTFLLKQLEANISPVINVETFLPVIDVLILRISTIEQNIVFKAGKGYIKISGSSAAKNDVKLQLFLQCGSDTKRKRRWNTDKQEHNEQTWS